VETITRIINWGTNKKRFLFHSGSLLALCQLFWMPTLFLLL
jgi:hypothetical protein